MNGGGDYDLTATAVSDQKQIASTTVHITVIDIPAFTATPPPLSAATILDLAATLGVDYLIIGASQRTAMAKLLGGSVVTSVVQQLPDSIRLVIFG